ncbi:MAG TPA: threonine synthase, partial [Bacteroidetes bacterium]|nr:threonine synthase [Bacteroidota bacterium]
YFNRNGNYLNLLVATSGDTGSAIGRAFQGIPGIFVYILYPRQEVSPKQEAQLTSINGNVRAVSVDGKFDDCQKMVKSAFLDPELRLFHLTSGNSINIGRLLPQMVYYFYAYSRLAKYEEKVIFSIPSGNFGNAIGCEIAYRMGLPVEKIIIATNENDEFPGFLQNGRYEKISPSRRCLSNSMNVGHPSNLGRLFDLYGGNVDKDGYVHRNPDRTAMRRHIFGVGISDSETIDTMVRIWREKKVILEPHGAVAFAGLESFREQEGEPDLPQIVLETAHPGKFSEVLQEYLGVTPEMPESLKHLQLKNHYIVLPNEYRIFKEYLFENLKR